MSILTMFQMLGKAYLCTILAVILWLLIAASPRSPQSDGRVMLGTTVVTLLSFTGAMLLQIMLHIARALY